MIKEDKILFIDTETGGTNFNENSLLSIALVVWKNNEIIDQTEILINDGVLNVTPKALEINSIDIEEHKKKAFNSEKSIKEIFKFLRKHFPIDEKVIVGGHNINFDVNFLRTFLQNNNKNFNDYFSHRYVDTATILYYLYLGKVIKKKAISSQEAFDLFGIAVENRHTAIGDAIGTAKLFTILLKLITKKAKLNTKGDSGQISLFE